MRRLIIPNFHVILIHFPLAILGFGLFIEIFSILWRRSSFQSAGRWMILIGTLALAPALSTGTFALFDVVSKGNDMSQGWRDLRDSSGFSAQDWHDAKMHLIFTGIGAAIAMIVVISWLGGSGRWRRTIYLPGLIALVIAMSLIGFGAWHGGEMIFKQGFGVDGAGHPIMPMASSRFEAIVSPAQVHLLFAGLVVAIAAGSLGVSLRRSALAEEMLLERPPVLEDPRGSTPGAPPKISIVGALYDTSRPRVVASIPPSLPGMRLWLLAAALAVVTIGFGFYIGGFLAWPHILNIQALRDAFKSLRKSGERRMIFHILFGASILVLLLLLALAARFWPRNRIMLGVLATLLTLIVAAQVYLGILLLYDGDMGPLAHFH